MKTAFVLVGLTAGTRETSRDALTSAATAFVRAHGKPPATEPRFAGYEPNTMLGMRVARYEADYPD